MTQQEARIREILTDFCDANGGGAREIEVVTGRYGGFYVTLAWEKFDEMEFAERHKRVSRTLKSEMGPNVYQFVRKLHLRSLNERAYEKANVEDNQPDRAWLYC